METLVTSRQFVSNPTVHTPIRCPITVRAILLPLLPAQASRQEPDHNRARCVLFSKSTSFLDPSDGNAHSPEEILALLRGSSSLRRKLTNLNTFFLNYKINYF